MSYAKYKDLPGGEKKENFSAPNQQPSDSKITYIKDFNHKKQLIESHRICLVYIYADWCQPCKNIAAKYTQMSNKYASDGLCLIAKENVEVGISPDVRGVPTFQFFKDGKYLTMDIVGADILSVEKRLNELIQSLN
jgi:thioredoxin-like negative regulator of GroEL